MTSISQDLRYSARLLRKHPGSTVTAVAVLTLGIGVNAGIFGIINGLMIRPIAGADAPGEIVGVFSQDRTAARVWGSLSRACCSYRTEYSQAACAPHSVIVPPNADRPCRVRPGKWRAVTESSPHWQRSVTTCTAQARTLPAGRDSQDHGPRVMV
jgi:hypothetical protein